MKMKQGLQQEYDKYVTINSDDEYSKACVDAGEAVGKALDEGKTGEQALEALKGHGLTGFMATMAVKAVAHFHPRGEEIRIAWNKDWGAEKLSQGIVNPAIVTISDDGKMIPEVENT